MAAVCSGLSLFMLALKSSLIYKAVFVRMRKLSMIGRLCFQILYNYRDVGNEGCKMAGRDCKTIARMSREG